jgi:hypothetical protein
MKNMRQNMAGGGRQRGIPANMKFAARGVSADGFSQIIFSL